LVLKGASYNKVCYVHKDERNVNAFLAMYVDDLLILNESVKVITIENEGSWRVKILLWDVSSEKERG
jgi:hypothetical protein